MANDSLPDRPLNAVCWCVIDCGLQTWWWDQDDGPKSRTVREIRIGWELSHFTKGGRRQVLTKRYNRSFWPTSALQRDLTSWVGGLPRDGRAGQISLARLIGRGALLHTEITVTGYRRITKVEHGPQLSGLDRWPLWFSLDHFDPAAFHQLPDRLKDYVMISPTFLAQHGHPTDPPEHTRPATGGEILDDEIPW